MPAPGTVLPNTCHKGIRALNLFNRLRGIIRADVKQNNLVHRNKLGPLIHICSDKLAVLLPVPVRQSPSTFNIVGAGNKSFIKEKSDRDVINYQGIIAWVQVKNFTAQSRFAAFRNAQNQHPSICPIVNEDIAVYRIDIRIFQSKVTQLLL